MPPAGTWLRSTPFVALIAAALALSLVLGVGFLAVHRLRDLRGAAVEAPAVPLSDAQAEQQVLDAARQFVGAGRLKTATGSYLLMSCKNADEPPYQGAIYLNFDVPPLARTPGYFTEIVAALTELGWTEGQSPTNHPGGRTLTRDGVSAIFYPNPDIAGRGTLQLYGECRDVTDHRMDTTGWTDITDRLHG